MASIQKMNGKWRYRVSYKEGDKYKTKTKGGFRTKREAELAAAEVEQQFHRGFDINAGDQLFPEYMRNWYEVFRKGKKSIENDVEIERTVRFVEDAFAGVRMKDITKQMYQKVLNELGKNRTTATVRKYHIYMKLCLKEALAEGIIYRDPTIEVTVEGKRKSKEEELKYLNYEESQKLIAEIKRNLQPRYMSRYIILFALATGCRFSEIIGLTWNNVDLKNKKVTIKQTWDYKYMNEFSNTKSYASKRVVTIDDDTIKLLKELKVNQSKQALKSGLGDKYNPHNLVFINNRMELISNNAVNKTLKSLCDKLGLKEITFHALRHTHASILLYKNVNIKYISKRLGHSDVSMTYKVYSHIIDEMEQMENRAVDNIMKDLFNV